MKSKVYAFFIILFLSPALSAGDIDHSLFTAILQSHVKNGKVNYTTLRSDKRLERYIALLSNTNPSAIAGQKARLAFWINVYNAFTLHLVSSNYPVTSIKDIGSIFRSVWDRKFIFIAGVLYSLNDVEHRIIRIRFKDPGVHFALVCAAMSCPPLRNEAYTGSRLDKQLKDQGRRFIQNSMLNSFHIGEKKVYISSIFKWYRKDFPRSDRSFLIFLAEFTSPDVRRVLKNDPSGWKIYFKRYNWRLNRQ